MCKKCADVDEMIGKKFGKLTVLERVENDKSRSIQYLCECECGNRTRVRKYNLIHNISKSCGRCKQPKPGDKFGKLTVIKKSDKKDKHGNAFFECKCDCGNTTEVYAGSLVYHRTVSCGRCKEPKPGDKFGKLTVIKKSDKKNKHGSAFFECKCDCGNTTEVVVGSLVSGRTKSCGHCKDLKPGEHFGNLTIIRKAAERCKNGACLYECICDCGNMIKVPGISLRSGRTKSCGCLGSSSGEYDIYKFLDANFISYIREKEIEKLITSKNGHPRFDFELFDKYGNNFFLEFHGEQHYWPTRQAEFGEQQREETDPMKVKYCEDNQLSLHVINCFEDVDSSLTRILYYREMLTPERLERNKAVYKIKRTLFTDKDGHLSIFSDREEIPAAA